MGGHPLSACRSWSWTPRLRPALHADTGPVARATSVEHGKVVPDVPRASRRAVCGACGGGEPCQRHVSPRNPTNCETTVDTPPPAAISPHAATSQSGPIESASCPREASTPPAPAANRTAPRLRRGTTVGTSPAAPLPQATLGSGSNHPSAPSKYLTHSPTARHRLRPRRPGSLLASHQQGYIAWSMTPRATGSPA
jgi:hypothetical protein